MAHQALIQLGAAIAAAATGVPVFVDERNASGGSNKLMSRSPAVVEILRLGTDGTVAIYGADLPNCDQGDTDGDGAIDAQVIDGDGTTTEFTTGIPYAAFSNYNFLVVSGYRQARSPSILEQGAGAGKYQVSDDGGYAKITFGTAPVAGVRVAIAKVTPAEIVAAATTQYVKTGVVTRDCMWVVTVGGTVSGTDVWLRGHDA